jgi:hypothetical protein
MVAIEGRCEISRPRASPSFHAPPPSSAVRSAPRTLWARLGIGASVAPRAPLRPSSKARGRRNLTGFNPSCDSDRGPSNAAVNPRRALCSTESHDGRGGPHQGNHLGAPRGEGGTAERRVLQGARVRAESLFKNGQRRHHRRSAGHAREVLPADRGIRPFSGSWSWRSRPSRGLQIGGGRGASLRESHIPASFHPRSGSGRHRPRRRS